MKSEERKNQEQPSEVQEIKLSGQVSAEQIAMWKNMYRDVYEVIATDKVCYLKRPDRKTLKAVDAIGETDGDKANEILLANCWLGGDEEIKTNDIYFLEVVPVLERLVDYGRAEIKKL
ncbi:MAG: hypothetical protein FWC34_11105 [Bacteroidetes bacterium]|nr:hypothetical protein [Bacteroidota bacterium]MCL2302910.1 hypothetical protein [Lentimicrobiaceae bacterium]